MVGLQNRLLLGSLMVGTLAFGAVPAQAVQVDLIKIGTWTTAYCFPWSYREGP